MRRTPGYKGIDPGVFTAAQKSADDKNGAKARTIYSTPSPTLRKNEVRDTKQKDAITQALLKAKNKYVYTSGNLRDRLTKRGPNKMIEA